MRRNKAATPANQPRRSYYALEYYPCIIAEPDAPDNGQRPMPEGAVHIFSNRQERDEWVRKGHTAFTKHTGNGENAWYYLKRKSIRPGHAKALLKRRIPTAEADSREQYRVIKGWRETC